MRDPSLLYLPRRRVILFSRSGLEYLTLEAGMKNVEGSVHMEEFSSADSFSPIMKEGRQAGRKK